MEFENSRIIAKACTEFLNYKMSVYTQHNFRAKMRRQEFLRKLSRKLRSNATVYQENIRATLEMVMLNIPNRKSRKMWMKARSKHWYDTVFNSDNYDEMFENIRMDKETFQYICHKLSTSLAPHPLHVRESIDVRMKVAIALYKLSSCAEYRVIGNQFGVHKSTVKKCVYQFCEALIENCLCEEIYMPTGEELIKVIDDFEKRSKLPQVFGAIDGTHIPITPQSEGLKDYVNRKGWPSLVLQAVVDSSYLFRDITCKHPGCTHDAAVLRDSYLYKNSQQTELCTKLVGNKMIPAFIIGDPAYPLLPWLVKGYCGVKSIEEESFNVYLSKARVVVEMAFGRLKSRWRILQKRVDISVNFVPRVVATCCILHNILERRKVQFNEKWSEPTAEAARIFRQPKETDSASSIQGEELRDHLKQYMASKYPLLEGNYI